MKTMKIPSTGYPPWSATIKRLDVTKKHLKIAARYYGLTLRELYWYSHYYVESVDYHARSVTIQYSDKNMKGRINNNKVEWGAVCMVCFYNAAANKKTWLDALCLLENEYTYKMAEGRINEYGHSIRENAMSLYYRGDDANDFVDEEGDFDGSSKLLHPNQALELAKLFTSFLLNDIAINDFVHNAITLDVSWESEELTLQQVKDYRELVSWIMKVLWPSVYLMNETTELIPKRLLEIINMNDHNRYRATMMMVLYLIGLNDFQGNIIFAAGDIPMDDLGLLWIDTMLKGENIEDIRKCSNCKIELGEGYVLNGGDKYYCDECLPFSNESWKKETENNPDSYWTQWTEL